MARCEILSGVNCAWPTKKAEGRCKRPLCPKLGVPVVTGGRLPMGESGAVGIVSENAQEWTAFQSKTKGLRRKGNSGQR